MPNFQPTGIQLHLITGRKLMYYQDDARLVAKICEDLDGRIFAKDSLVIETLNDIMAFPGHALIGISVLTDPLPTSFFEREKISRTEITQITAESFSMRKMRPIDKNAGKRSLVLSELEFVSGEHLFLEFCEVAESGLDERTALHHLFSRPTLSCRRLEGGFSIWNTAKIVSWSHYPKFEVPANSWPTESLSQLVSEPARVVKML